ncbi:MAG TPA: carbonic anhydrase [Nitrospiraceae bacterium]|jgi:carbonic anhydrase|nr:carbonic anhydrase [Nitrospiraceae bacterium]
MEKLVKGFLKFRTEVFDKKKELFTRLSENQAPRALFITCSDSRVDPTLLTQTDPGELFILRNAGNMVPPYGSMQGGSTATIEYAMAVLKVPHIIVCGHTDCGVMRALLHPEEVHDLPAVKEWVGQAETTRRLIRTTQENVRSQLDHLRTHPSVAVLLRQKKVDLHGWVYSISTGDVWVYDLDSERFTSLLDDSSPRLKAAR